MKIIMMCIILTLSLNAKTYTLSSGDTDMQIVAHKVLDVAYKRAHLKMKVNFLQQEASLESANTGKTDGEVARIKTIPKLYPNLVIVPVAISNIQAIALSLDKNIHISKWSDLSKYDFTIIKGIKFIEESTKDMNKTIVNTLEDAFSALQNKQTKVIVITQLSALKMIYINHYKDIKIVSNSLQSLKLYHFVHKRNADIIPLLTSILENMQKSGEIRYWYNSYLRKITPVQTTKK